MRLAFLGFRHAHVMSLYSSAKSDPRVQIVAAAEDDPQTVAQIRTAGAVRLTHDNYQLVLRDDSCDVVAIGDYFARRGSLILAALRAGKHVIADKPICTSLDELDQIESLARQKKLVVSALLDLRDRGVYRTMRKLIRDDRAIGTVHTILMTAQHPLAFGKRPGWYFEPGKHGGTINDIGVHATDLIPWLTGRQIKKVIAARAWNARLPQHPHFQDAAQFMLALDNGGSAFTDVSYLAPDGIAYNAPQYWRITCHGSEGFVETDYNATCVHVCTSADQSSREIPAEANVPSGRIDDLLAEIQGKSSCVGLTTPDVIRASRVALESQQIADNAQ